MSQTDSENEYESADEADQHVFEAKAHVLGNETSDTHEKHHSQGNDKLPFVDSCLSVKEEMNNMKVNDKKECEGTEDNAVGSNADCPVQETSELSAANTSNRIRVCSQGNSEGSERKNSDVQHKRVTLRLEKKLHQKNQAVINSSTVANEEPKQEEKVSSWGFGSWGSSLLSTAAASVSTFTSQVSQGLGTVLETVETSLGATPPEDLASLLKERREASLNCEENEETNKPKKITDENDKEVEKEEEAIPSTSSLFTGVTSLTKVIESTGSKVLMGGLDTLELIGKKTYDIITEGDPGLRKKRSAFSRGVDLSQLLREAREKAEVGQLNTSLENEEETVHFSTFFDDFQGLVHLEALEMLSSQCQSKVQGAIMMMSGDSDIKEKLEHVKRICEDLPSADETPEDKSQNFDENLIEHLKALQLQIDMQRIQKVRSATHEWLDQCIAEQKAEQVNDAKELYRQAIKSLAEFTARCVEQFHKFGELILVQTDPDLNTLLCATHLTGLTSVLCVEVGIMANKYCQCLNTVADMSEDPDAVTPLITTVFLEASNSTTYIQDAFQLLVPVLQTSLLQ